MKIIKVRLGFATNSSSTHSIIFTKDYPKNLGIYEESDGEGQYGWEDFTLTDKLEKLHYMGLQYLYSLTQYMDTRVKGSVDKYSKKAKETVKNMFPEVDFDFENDYIDHQSHFNLPAFKSFEDFQQFWVDAKQFICHPNTVILGGNDNSEGHPLMAETYENDGKDSRFTIVDLFSGSYSSTMGMRNEGGGVWTKFDKHTGNTTTYSLVEENKTPAIKYPELVDIKITDWCDKGCPYCYQNSTPKGQHASVKNVMMIANALEKLQVFEAAIGGGEPTAHPDFPQILQAFNTNKITPNFSTRNIDCLKSSPLYTDLGLGAFAFSVDSKEDVDKIIEKFKELRQIKGYGAAGIGLHVVANVFNTHDEMLSFMNSVHELHKTVFHFSSLVLLGYKEKGRGAKHKSKLCNENVECRWIEAYKQYLKEHEEGKWNRFPLSIDTTFAKNVGETMLTHYGVDPMLYDIEEGKRSFYIDAVSMKMGVSSFVPDDELVPIDMDNVEKSIAEFWENLKKQ